MLAKVARFILAFATFPAIGAYGLRWAGGFVASVIRTFAGELPLIGLLPWIGGLLGLVLGLMLAIRLFGCSIQPEATPFHGTADSILIVLGLTLVVAAALPRALPGAPWLRWLPPVALVVWCGAAAATTSLHRMRCRWREQRLGPPPLAAPYPPAP